MCVCSLGGLNTSHIHNLTALPYQCIHSSSIHICYNNWSISFYWLWIKIALKLTFFYTKEGQSYYCLCRKKTERLSDMEHFLQPKTGLTPESSGKLSWCVVYGFWQGLCISRALCLTFPAVESITLQLTTAARCDHKEQLLAPHGGNSMRVPDERGAQTWSHSQKHLSLGDTNLLGCIGPAD